MFLYIFMVRCKNGACRAACTAVLLYCTTSGAKGTGGANSVSYTPAGTNSGGSVGNHKLTIAEIPSHKHLIYQDANGNGGRFGVVTSYGNTGGTSIQILGKASTVSNLTPDSGDNAKGLVNADYTGGGGNHNHGFTNPTFTGTAATINTIPQYIKCYAWYRTA